MRVISDKDADSGTVKVRINETDLIGQIICSNGRALRNGRAYVVKFPNGEQRECSGKEITRIP